MKAFITATTLFFSLLSMSFAQQLTQTIRGNIYDLDSEMPLIGAQVLIVSSSPLKGCTTDTDGAFRLEDVPIGRVSLQLTYLGYSPQVIPNIVVNSAKEVVVDFHMQESTLDLEEVVVTANTSKGEALNDMALISARSISPEETNRYAGGFNDPSRIMSNFAGVTSTQDGGNDIIVRGNSPKYIQWRLEGIQITNPNHFADQSSAGGATSTLNNNLLATSDFHTGAFTAEYGDVLSGVYDVKLRAGNNEKFESVFGFGLLGTDLTFEGPIKKGSGNSFLVNYRYSTAGLVSDLGLLGDIGGVPTFQDAAFKLMLPTKKIGVFSLFGLAGLSSFLWEDVTPATWETPGENVIPKDKMTDYEKKTYLMNTGLNHTLPIGNASYLKTTLLFSKESIVDEIFDSYLISIYDENQVFLRDSLTAGLLNFNSDIKKTTYRAAATYHNKLNAKNKIQIGIKYAMANFEMQQSQLNIEGTGRFGLVSLDEGIGTIRSFASWKHRINEQLTLVAGVHNMNVLLNKQSTLEPRLAFQWKMDNSNALSIGYGKHSNMESVHNYFSRVQGVDGQVTEPNKDLGLLKADHLVVGYERRFGKNIRAKLEAYYQRLYDIPVENDNNSFYATINEGLDFRYVDLVNEGTGKNYGLELTLEKFFVNNYYFLINASVYNSLYTPLDGKERNTQYNGNYLINVLFGKEFNNLGKKDNQALTLNAKVFLGGGKKIIPLLKDNDGNLAVDTVNGLYYDFEKAYDTKLDDIYAVLLSVSYKWNRPKTTHELFLNLDNLTNRKGRISEFYDESEPDNIGYVKTFGFFPNLMYRLYF